MNELAMWLYAGWPISRRMFLYVVDGLIIRIQLGFVDLERRNGSLVYFPHVL